MSEDKRREVTVTFTFNDYDHAGFFTLLESGEYNVKQLLMDALYEYRRAREGNYVVRRYATMGDKWKQSKKKEVLAKSSAAFDIQSAVTRAEFKEKK